MTSLMMTTTYDVEIYFRNLQIPKVSYMILTFWMKLRG